MSAKQQPTGRDVRPAWLDVAFVQEALRHGGDANATVETIEVTNASVAGENFCSSLFRVSARVRGRERALALLVKRLPEGDQWANLVSEARLFDRELIAFARVLPAMEALLADAAPDRFSPFAARCFRQSHAPAPFLVLQDLRPDGFRMKDRRSGLDLPHALLTMRALGRFHGASAALWRRRPQLFEGLLSFFDDAGSDLCKDFYDKSIDTTANTIESWTEFPGNYGQKVHKLRKNIYQKLKEVNRIRPGKFNVLIHGDFWVNNMLYCYENEEVQDIRFVDFQLSHVGNPAIDILLLLHTGLEEDVFDNHWDTLLEAYHATLSETLQLLGEEVPSLEDIRQDMEEARVYIFLATLIWLPGTRLEEGNLDLDKVMANDRKIHTSANLRHWLQKLLPVFEKRGMFDEVIGKS